MLKAVVLIEERRTRKVFWLLIDLFCKAIISGIASV